MGAGACDRDASHPRDRPQPGKASPFPSLRWRRRAAAPVADRAERVRLDGRLALYGAEGIRTPDLAAASRSLSQLSYGPKARQSSGEVARS